MFLCRFAPASGGSGQKRAGSAQGADWKRTGRGPGRGRTRTQSRPRKGRKRTVRKLETDRGRAGNGPTVPTDASRSADLKLCAHAHRRPAAGRWAAAACQAALASHWAEAAARLTTASASRARRLLERRELKLREPACSNASLSVLTGCALGVCVRVLVKLRLRCKIALRRQRNGALQRPCLPHTPPARSP